MMREIFTGHYKIQGPSQLGNLVFLTVGGTSPDSPVKKNGGIDRIVEGAVRGYFGDPFGVANGVPDPA